MMTPCCPEEEGHPISVFEFHPGIETDILGMMEELGLDVDEIDRRKLEDSLFNAIDTVIVDNSRTEQGSMDLYSRTIENYLNHNE